MQNRQALSNVTIVLVDTKAPANIGSAARCMMNMGLSRLALVNPPRDERRDIEKLAAGAEGIVQQATLAATLAEAIAGHHLVLGASRHAGRQRKNVVSPREAAGQAVPLLERNRVAVVFGNEVNGLDNGQLALCHEIVSIPASDAFPSLNLSHAVMVVAYEFFLAAGGGRPSLSRDLPPAEDLENFYRHLQETLTVIGFLDAARPERMMFALRQLVSRARPDLREIRILRGVLTEIDRFRKSGS
jgi:tRNA (cytidine32/uridine32-2'-O)-methyltransferase